MFWLDKDPHPELGLTLKRPDGTVVAATDPDVTDRLDVTGDDPFYVLLHGFAINSPAAGDWQVDVQGRSVPDRARAT